jgi:hypothetical protein
MDSIKQDQSMGIQYLSQERLKLLPSEYWAAHEFCFFLHDKILEILIEYDSYGVHNVVPEVFRKAVVEAGREKEFEDIDLLAHMRENNLIIPYKHHIISHVVLALTADMLHFLYEALACLEKRKFSVGFSLLRKPLKEHMFFLSWVLTDEDDFISRFESDNHISFDGVTKEKRLNIIKQAIEKLHLKEGFNEETIWNYVYSKKHVNGFEATWQRATHLTTSQGELLKTEDYSFNFIFEDAYDDFYYAFLGRGLPYLFLYLTQIVLASFSRIHPIHEKTVNHLMLVTMGCYEALFLNESPMYVGNMLQEAMGDLLACVHCDASFQINKKNAPMLYIHEKFVCEQCGLISEFPLYWLLAKSEVKHDS